MPTGKARQLFARIYAMQVARDLFDGWALLREWGRAGSVGQMRTMSYRDEAAAAAAMVRPGSRPSPAAGSA